MEEVEKSWMGIASSPPWSQRWTAFPRGHQKILDLNYDRGGLCQAGVRQRRPARPWRRAARRAHTLRGRPLPANGDTQEHGTDSPATPAQRPPAGLAFLAAFLKLMTTMRDVIANKELFVDSINSGTLRPSMEGCGKLRGDADRRAFGERRSIPHPIGT